HRRSLPGSEARGRGRRGLGQRRGDHRPGRRRADREDHLEARALAELALHADLSAVSLDVALHDRQTQARAPELTRARVVHLVEALEDLLQLVDGNSPPRVLYHAL